VDQFGGQSRQALDSTFRHPEFDPDILPVDEAELSERSLQCGLGWTRTKLARGENADGG
jgi:hypothetical protein